MPTFFEPQNVEQGISNVEVRMFHTDFQELITFPKKNLSNRSSYLHNSTFDIKPVHSMNKCHYLNNATFLYCTHDHSIP